MEYKRITKTDDRGRAYTDECFGCMEGVDCLDCPINEAVWKRLAELEDKIEQGKMIELPCKVGDTIWTINCWHEYGKKELGERYIVTRYELHENICSYISIHGKGYHKGDIVIHPKENHKGVTPWVFLTREEAENRLKELQNG